MGWGTFIAGQAISTVRRAGRKGRNRQRPLTAAERQELQRREANEVFLTVRAIFPKTPLIHPELASKVDMEYWETEMGRRLRKFRNVSEFLILTPVLAVILYGLFTYWPYPYGPDTNLWSFLAVAAVAAFVLVGFGLSAAETLARNLVARSVRIEFAAEGYDVGELIAEGSVLAQAKDARRAAAAEKLRADDRAKQKKERFGN